MRTAPVDLTELIDAYGAGSDAVEFYLDLETGAVIPVTAEVRAELALLDDEAAAGDAAGPSLGERIDRRQLPDWLREAVLEAIQIEALFGERYVRVPGAEASDDYRAMANFIETVADHRLQARLWRAIEGRGAFRRFRDVLADAPTERERWHAWLAAEHRRRVLDWLADEEIEVAPA
jgi:hypothetical protein